MWKLIGGGVVLALAGFLIWQFGESRFDSGKLTERTEWAIAARKAAEERAAERVAAESRVTAAVQGYADALAAMEPVVVRSMDKVREYERTPAGAVRCLSDERVRGIEADAAALGLATAAPALAAGDGVPANADPDAGGRGADQR